VRLWHNTFMHPWSKLGTKPIILHALWCFSSIAIVCHYWFCNFLTRYRLHILGSDDTGEAEFTFIGRLAQDITGVSPQEAILNNYRGIIPIANLAIASAQIRHTSLSWVPLYPTNISSLYAWQPIVSKVSWASLNVRTVEACYSPEWGKTLPG
jgi:hypothetical protein